MFSSTQLSKQLFLSIILISSLAHAQHDSSVSEETPTLLDQYYETSTENQNDNDVRIFLTQTVKTIAQSADEETIQELKLLWVNQDKVKREKTRRIMFALVSENPSLEIKQQAVEFIIESH